MYDFAARLSRLKRIETGGGTGVAELKLIILAASILYFNLGGFLPERAFAHQKEDGAAPEPEGFQALKDGDNRKALELFNAAARARPDSAEAHYGRARALAELGRKDEAAKEYKLALLLNPAEDLAKLCQEKLSSLTSREENIYHNEMHSNAAAHTVHPQDVEGSISRILKQSEEKINSIHSGSESYASTIYNARADAHNKLMEQARKEAEEMRRARVIWGRRLIPSFNEADIRAKQVDLQSRSSSALEQAKADYKARKQDAETRALGVKQSAEGLESQMINKPAETSGVFLVPEGTNLYVRNYGHFDPVMPEPLEALQAVPLKLPQVLKIQEEQRKKSKNGSPKNYATEPLP